MRDLIDRMAALNYLYEFKIDSIPISSDELEIKGYNDGIDLAISVLSQFPSYISAGATHVEFIDDNNIIARGWQCQNCHSYVNENDKYCHECGILLEWG